MPMPMFADADDVKAAAYARELGDKMGKTEEFRLKDLRWAFIWELPAKEHCEILAAVSGVGSSIQQLKNLTNSNVANLRRRGLGGADLLTGVITWTSGGDGIHAGRARGVYGWGSVYYLLEHNEGYGRRRDNDGGYVMALMEAVCTTI